MVKIVYATIKNVFYIFIGEAPSMGSKSIL